MELPKPFVAALADAITRIDLANCTSENETRYNIAEAIASVCSEFDEKFGYKEFFTDAVYGRHKCGIHEVFYNGRHAFETRHFTGSITELFAWPTSQRLYHATISKPVRTRRCASQ
ncbi:MAG TPA: hypothetical protein VEG44_04150 [Candidatus Acidoferrales bacterium]|nr:hypothetical protein [Candidatus Acidoferrales bacterium]